MVRRRPAWRPLPGLNLLDYTHAVETCFAESLGERGLDRAAYEAHLGAAEAPRARLREQWSARTLPILSLPARRDDLAAIRAASGALTQNCRRFVLIGAGGSSLGAQCLADLAGARRSTPFIFLDGLDGDSLDDTLAADNLEATGFIVISKSGGTVEPLAQTLVAIRALETAGIGPLAERFLLVVERGESPLRRLAARFELPVLDHDPAIGGRYSVLSVVGALPALLLGLDPVALREGAETALARSLDGPIDAAPAAVGAALAVGLWRERGIGESVLMPYADRLRRLGPWYCQLWAESLGKGGQGTTPIQARGPADQHSLLQLFLDGPANKLFTLITVDAAGTGARVPADLAAEAGLGFLGDRLIGDIVAAQARATAATLVARGRPTRVIGLPQLDERALGALFMHFMLETIIAGGLLGIDPFDQPAVEEGKVLTRRDLEEAI